MGTKGREALAAIAPETARYFIEQCSSSNYAVREAACHCMGEMATKVDPARVAPQVGGMLRALLGAMGDVNWPVREAACEGKTWLARRCSPTSAMSSYRSFWYWNGN